MRARARSSSRRRARARAAHRCCGRTSRRDSRCSPRSMRSSSSRRARRIVVDTCVGDDKPRALEMLEPAAAVPRQRRRPASPGFDRTVLRPPPHSTTSAGTPASSMAVGCRRFRTRARCSAASSSRTDRDRRPDERQIARRFGAADPRRRLAEQVDLNHVLTSVGAPRADPGHAGHVSCASLRWARAVITGDLMHHPIQCCEPDRSVHSMSIRAPSDAGLSRTPLRSVGAQCSAPTSRSPPAAGSSRGEPASMTGAAWLGRFNARSILQPASSASSTSVRATIAASPSFQSSGSAAAGPRRSIAT